MDYKKLRSVNASLLKECIKSPFHGYQYLNRIKEEQTSSMSLGTLVHSLVLEPEKTKDNFLVIPKGARTNSYKDSCEGKEIVREQTFKEAKEIAKEVLGCEASSSLLKNAKKEMALQFDVNGTMCKSRIDAYSDGVLIELKTSNEIYPRDFVSSIIRFGYDVQAAFYCEALKRNGFPVERVVMIKVTNEAPYIVDVFELDKEFIDLGYRKIDRVFHVASKLISGWIPEQRKEIVLLNCPEWALEK